MSIVAILTFTRTHSIVELAAVLTPKQAAQILKLETRLETGLRIAAALFALPIHHAARAVPVRPRPRAAVLVLVCCDADDQGEVEQYRYCSWCTHFPSK